uniref:Chemokine like factor n=1 Tax=Rousettus aegyptiacus TaxID=9407 RepID=A0A7J8CF26_ROUAE|nr:chemokine like factor [Rousettus aegyptiacus]
MSTLKLKSKHRPFCFSVKGHVKMFRLALTVTSMTFFIISQAPEPYIVITGFEVTIIFFFIILYMFRLDRIINCIFWPLLDLINTFITAVFLLIVAILTIQEKDRRHLFYVGGTLCLTAAILCLVDATLVTKTMRNNIKRALGMKKEPDHSLAQAEPPNPPSKNL